MPRFDESCVLIPVSTLEDFPRAGSDAEARNLLAAWSVLWHPAIIHAAGGCPTWYRDDGPPVDEKRRIVAIPDGSMAKLPAQFAGSLTSAPGSEQKTADEGSDVLSWQVSGPDRTTMLRSLGLAESGQADSKKEHVDWGDVPAQLSDGPRTLTPDDFFALAYATLQIQVMTRRLRYSSNLDEIAVHHYAKAAADAYMAGEASDAVAAMHDAFDLISQERDHYFASDPSLIDLTLLTPAVLTKLELPPANGSDNEHPPGAAEPAASTAIATQSITDPTPAVLPTPTNVLIDEATCGSLAAVDDAIRTRLRSAIADREIGWAAGGPSDACFDELTLDQSQ